MRSVRGYRINLLYAILVYFLIISLLFMTFVPEETTDLVASDTERDKRNAENWIQTRADNKIAAKNRDGMIDSAPLHQYKALQTTDSLRDGVFGDNDGVRNILYNVSNWRDNGSDNRIGKNEFNVEDNDPDRNITDNRGNKDSANRVDNSYWRDNEQHHRFYNNGGNWGDGDPDSGINDNEHNWGYNGPHNRADHGSYNGTYNKTDNYLRGKDKHKTTDFRKENKTAKQSDNNIILLDNNITKSGKTIPSNRTDKNEGSKWQKYEDPVAVAGGRNNTIVNANKGDIAASAKTAKVTVKEGAFQTSNRKKSGLTNQSQTHDGNSNATLLSPGYLGVVGASLTSRDWKTIPFMENYRNPCWKERLTQSSAALLYKNNSLIEQEPKSEMIRMNSALNSYLMRTLMNRLVGGQSESWHIRCLPYFYIIGQAKCGTTDLWTKLKMHPHIKPGLKKEYHWWARYRAGAVSRGEYRKVELRHYAEMFDIAASAIEQCTDVPNGTKHPCVTGDISISTMAERPFFPSLPRSDAFSVPDPPELVPGLMYRLQPDARLIVMLRNPVERLYSAYNYFTKYTYGRVPSAFEFHNRVVKALPVVKECFRLYGVRACAYNPYLKCRIEVDIGEGIYWVFFKDWLSIYPRSQILILTLEDYIQNKTGVLDQALRHINLDPNADSFQSKASNQKLPTQNKGIYENMLLETASLLTDFYKPFNLELVKLLNDSSFTMKWSDDALIKKLSVRHKHVAIETNTSKGHHGYNHKYNWNNKYHGLDRNHTHLHRKSDATGGTRSKIKQLVHPASLNSDSVNITLLNQTYIEDALDAQNAEVKGNYRVVRAPPRRKPPDRSKSKTVVKQKHDLKRTYKARKKT